MRQGYELTIEQTQKPLMTQELIQAIQILQFNNQELTEYVENELLENPMLETQKDKTAEETVDIDNLRESISENWDPDREEFSFERYVSFRYSLVEHLLSQLQFSGLRGEEEEAGRYIIQCIDDNGYLAVSIDDISKMSGINQDVIENALKVVQTFDPSGVGARTLSECLSIQLDQEGNEEENIRFLINEKLEDLAANRISQLAREMKLKINEVQDMADKIKKMEPKPGRLYDSDQTIKYIIPDIFIDSAGDAISVRTNQSGIPHLIVSPYYHELKKEKDNAELNKYLADKLSQATWLIRSIEQRQNTIHKVASAIAEYQHEFFKNGPRYLKPLTLKQISEQIGVHESTVSRSINGKYLQCEQGVLELKYFFSGGVHSEEGEDVSSSSIKAMIRELIESENPKKPYSDMKLAEMLSNDGIEISRRTVAKYRDAIGIQSSSRRRRF